VTYSIVVPLYDKGPHVRRALESIAAQEFADFEALVVDDGSADGGDAIAAEFAAADSRFRLLRRSPPGPGGYAARNLGIAEARGEWTAFLDADDEWMPGFLSEMDRLRRSCPEARFLSSAYLVAERSGRLRPSRFSRSREGIVPAAEFVSAAARGRWPTHTSSVVVERSALLAAGLFPAGRCGRGGDRDTWLRLVLSVPYAWTPFVGAVYRTDSVSMVTRTVEHPREPCVLVAIASALGSGGAGTRDRRLRGALRRLHNASLRSYLTASLAAGSLGSAELGRLRWPVDAATLGALGAAAIRGLLRPRGRIER
jgi:glycosyltransferase involved in cell wall biosynthesis